MLSNRVSLVWRKLWWDFTFLIQEGAACQLVDDNTSADSISKSVTMLAVLGMEYTPSKGDAAWDVRRIAARVTQPITTPERCLSKHCQLFCVLSHRAGCVYSEWAFIKKSVCNTPHASVEDRSSERI